VQGIASGVAATGSRLLRHALSHVAVVHQLNVMLGRAALLTLAAKQTCSIVARRLKMPVKHVQDHAKGDPAPNVLRESFVTLSSLIAPMELLKERAWTTPSP